MLHDVKRCGCGGQIKVSTLDICTMEELGTVNAYCALCKGYVKVTLEEWKQILRDRTLALAADYRNQK